MNDDTKAAVEAISAWAAGKALVISTVGAAWGWLMSSQFISLASLCLAAIGLVANLYFKIRADRREQREYEKRMQKMETKPIALQDES